MIEIFIYHAGAPRGSAVLDQLQAAGRNELRAIGEPDDEQAYVEHAYVMGAVGDAALHDVRIVFGLDTLLEVVGILYEGARELGVRNLSLQCETDPQTREAINKLIDALQAKPAEGMH